MFGVLLAWPAFVFADAESIGARGVVEMEATAEHGESGTTATGPGVNKIEPEFAFPLASSFDAMVRFKREDQASEIDEATLRYRLGENGSSSITFGKAYLPFGQFETALVSDPLALTIAESRAYALLVANAGDRWQSSIFVAPDSTSRGNDAVGGAAIRYQYGETWQGHTIGVAAISNIAIANGIRSGLPAPGLAARPVPAASIDAAIGSGQYRLLLEAVIAADRFAAADINFAGSGAQPSTWRVEVARRRQLKHWPLTLAASWQQSAEAVGLDIPESRLAMAIGMELSSATALALEWARDSAYAVSVGGSGSRSDRLTLQFALNF